MQKSLACLYTPSSVVDPPVPTHKPLTPPQIHRNGSSPDTLISDLCDAGCHLGEALEALRKCAPNQRDFYHVPDGTALWHRALAEHLVRCERITAIQEELGALAEAIAAQRDA